MSLYQLVAHYDALAELGEVARLGWCVERVSFLLNLSTAGELLGVVPILHEELRGKKTVQVPRNLTVPERVVRSSGIKANFICDNAIYLLGIDQKGRPDRAKDCFVACKELHLSALDSCTGEAACAVKAFFESWNPEEALEHPALEKYLDSLPGANLAFLVDGEVMAHEDREISGAWKNHYQTAGEGVVGRCMVTGDMDKIATIHGKIKGIRGNGAQPSGVSLISFNSSAYESYGKEGDKPKTDVGERAAFAYVTVLNHLLASEKNRCSIGDSSVVFWAERGDKKIEEMFFSWQIPKPDEESKLEGVMRNMEKGRLPEDIDFEKRFYVLGLAPNAARVSVRFFWQSSFGEVIRNMQQHYSRLEIERPVYDTRIFLDLFAILRETVNPHSKDKTPSPLLSGEVMRSILSGSRYPQSLYSAIITRIRADRNVSRARAAIIKAFLIHNNNEEEVTTLALNEASENRAYVLGRLFAILEELQLKAIINIKATIKDRYFTSACATPAVVFPLLLRLSNFHKAKSDGENRYFDIMKTRLLSKLDIDNDPLPIRLSLQDQGIFILGYYHQVQARYNGNKKQEENNHDSDQQ